MFVAVDAVLPLGDIPSELGSLTALTELRLDWNQFSGTAVIIDILYVQYLPRGESNLLHVVRFPLALPFSSLQRVPSGAAVSSYQCHSVDWHQHHDQVFQAVCSIVRFLRNLLEVLLAERMADPTIRSCTLHAFEHLYRRVSCHHRRVKVVCGLSGVRRRFTWLLCGY